MAKEHSVTGDVIFRSKLPDIEIPTDLPLHKYCFQKLPKIASRTCIINCANEKIYTYADVDLISRRVAAGFHRIGVRKGDVIMLLLPNSPEFIFAFLGASMRGAIITAANPLHTAAEVEKHAKAARAKVLITRACDVDKVKEVTVAVEGKPEERIKIVCIDAPPPECTAFADMMAAEEADLPEVEIDAGEVVVMPFSSGTTGLPKGVMLSHRSNVTSIAQQVDGDNPNLYFKEDDVMLCVLPLFHIYSLNVTLCALRAGASVAIMQRYETKALLEVLQKYRVTLVPVVPPIVLAMAKSDEAENFDLSSVRIVQCGAAPIGKELEDSVSAKFPNAKFGQGYGMTEAGPVLAMSLGFAKEPFEVKMGACGTVVRNSEMKIVDPETGVSLQRNQPGEICIRGDQVMKGYLNDPEATTRTVDKGGWLHTGDIGYVDDDDELFIVDRLKEIIKYKGFQVAPAELEAMLVSHPVIMDCAVIGMKDEAAGELPIAFVVKAKDAHVLEDDIKQFISKQVVFYKRIHKVHFVDKIPKAPTGKILRKDLRKRLEEEMLEVVDIGDNKG